MTHRAKNAHSHNNVHCNYAGFSQIRSQFLKLHIYYYSHLPSVLEVVKSSTGILWTEVLNYVCIQIFIIIDNKVHPCPITGIILEVFWMYGVIRREETQDNWLDTV